MSFPSNLYCLDANVLIVSWGNYYSPKFCPSYWEVLKQLGQAGRIFLPQMVFDEIARTEDDLAVWLRASNIPIKQIDEAVTTCLRNIFDANPVHLNLVDSSRNRSLADPWVIAHAISENACVVTKEERIRATNTTKVKIPNVCDNMNIKCINDFQLVEELNIQFKCVLD